MLDDLNRIKKFDTGRVGDSISLLPRQMSQVLAEAKSIKMPAEYKKINQVVIKGMGGSNLGAHIIMHAMADQIKVPFSISPDYTLPAYVNNKTLLVLSSYSGTTEEVLSVYAEAKKRQAKIVAIVSQGKSGLEKIIKRDKLPAYIFKPEANPSNQPRLGLGYSILGIASLLSAAGLFKLDPAAMDKIIASLEQWNKNLEPQSLVRNNDAKRLALGAFKKQPILVGGEFLTGNLHAMRNQICENSKNFASYLPLPDLNHFAMEGLANPSSNASDLAFIFFNSSLYSPRIQKRARLTNEVVKKNKIGTMEYVMRGETKLEQAFELLQLGAWFSLYLGILNQVNPVEIKWVDWFKQKLAE